MKLTTQLPYRWLRSLSAWTICLSLLLAVGGCGGADAPNTKETVLATAEATSIAGAMVTPAAPTDSPSAVPAGSSATPGLAASTTLPLDLPATLPLMSSPAPAATPQTAAPDLPATPTVAATATAPLATSPVVAARPATATVADGATVLPRATIPPSVVPLTHKPVVLPTHRPTAPPTAPPTGAARPAATARATTPPQDTSTPAPAAVAATDTPRPVEIVGADPGTAMPDGRIQVGGQAYDAYIPAVLKTHQDYHYTCEFDAAWVVLKTYGFDASLQDMLNIVGVDTSREPTWEETPQGVIITGGDILHFYSGNYVTNFLARTTGLAMRKLFAHFGLSTTPVHTQAGIEAALRGGSLVWIKTTADFLPGRPATWILPDGTTYQTVLGNDHAAVIMGFNADGVLIRDVLGPTSTNMQRQYQYQIAWPRFLRIWASQSNDGLAVAPPGHR